MHLRNAVGMLMKKRALLLGALILLVAAVPALAANVTGNGTLVGTTGSDNLAAGNGNDTIWGLGGADNISAGNGNDVIDANGKCPPGVKSGDYPNGLPSTQYCEHGQVPGSSDNIAAGNGNDTVYGGGGTNNISVGNGDNTIYGGPIGDTIHAGSGKGQGNDIIHLDQNTTGTQIQYTGSTVYVAQGDDLVYAQNGTPDTIVCPSGNQTTVYADKVDSTKGCHRVIYTPAPTAGRFRPAHRAATSRRAHKKAHRRSKLTHRKAR
jgi:Ca2+-binding RTX toxin-like protein